MSRLLISHGALGAANVAVAAWLGWRLARGTRNRRSGTATNLALVAVGMLTVFALINAARAALALSALTGSASVQDWVITWGSLAVGAVVLVLVLVAGAYATRLLGALVMAERAMEVVVGQLHPELQQTDEIDLTPREREVLAVIATGLISDDAIAEVLFISPATASTHVRNILRKTRLKDRRQLVIVGLRGTSDSG